MGTIKPTENSREKWEKTLLVLFGGVLLPLQLFAGEIGPLLMKAAACGQVFAGIQFRGKEITELEPQIWIQQQLPGVPGKPSPDHIRSLPQQRDHIKNNKSQNLLVWKRLLRSSLY